ncbi:protein-glutamate methylesterase/protein-glutamine glutaminase [Spirochaeta lutea]|uniref:Protein-glutamate methylesterase/protein-glutamine glutaminase n=1 Tax=Spirochaeta lutea TaxID=1480694 RepID=A0A098QWW4_9SPIO|nr:chemotaxis response regulator protein-glutamate methylesterase [Spirochaeta lutea]KGE71883.1 chemotaxis protein CheY [Spirochaeta lutea]
MEKKPIQVLVVDDSALMRNIVSRIVDSAPDLEVAGKAMNGRFALQKIETLKPDLIILDLEMPDINGLEFLQERRKREIDIPVIVLSAVARRGASITMEALSLGAADFIMKPTGGNPDEVQQIASQLIELARSYGATYRQSHGLAPIGLKPGTEETQKKSPGSATAPAEIPGLRTRQDQAIPGKPGRIPSSPSGVPLRKRSRAGGPGPLELIALGISTGGPNALRQVFSGLDPELQTPILVVQHMPAGFTLEFAKSLDRICPMEVKEAEEGDLVRPGRILIAPGDYHIVLERKRLATIVHLDSGPAKNGHRPSADVLFESAASIYGNRCMGVIMTGMGRDGAEHIGDIWEAGGITLGQDQQSSVVYGMPRVAYEYGHILKQVSLSDMAKAICDYAAELV